MDNITRHKIILNSGNSLHVFFNHDTNLLVIDIIDHKDRDGNEIIRQHIDENKLLGHISQLESVNQPDPKLKFKPLGAHHLKGDGLKFQHTEEQ